MKNKIIAVIFASWVSACATQPQQQTQACKCPEPIKAAACASDDVIKNIRANLEQSQAELNRLSAKIKKNSKAEFSKLNNFLNSIGKSVNELTQGPAK